MPVFYPFPQNLTIEEVRHVITRHNERTGTKAFIEVDRGDHLIFNYVVAFDGSFPTPQSGDPALDREYAILRECRGLVMATATGRVLARRYHKFFNLGERAEVLPENIDFSQPHVILEKLDGSLVTAIPRGDGCLSWGTKMGLTDVAVPVSAFVAQQGHYLDFVKTCVTFGLTPIFEWCSRQQRIVIDYPEDQLVLTAVRHNENGAYLCDEVMRETAAEWGIPVVKSRPGSIDDIMHFMAEAQDLEGAEGYVIRFANGHMLKVKGAWYCSLHRTKEMLQWEKDVWALILHDKLDDAKAFMDGPDRDRIDRFASAFEGELHKTAERLHRVVAGARAALGDNKKRFATEIVVDSPSCERGLLFRMWDGHDPVTVVKDHLRANIGSQTKVDGVRRLVGGLDWNSHRGATVDLAA